MADDPPAIKEESPSAVVEGTDESPCLSGPENELRDFLDKVGAPEAFGPLRAAKFTKTKLLEVQGANELETDRVSSNLALQLWEKLPQYKKVEHRRGVDPEDHRVSAAAATLMTLARGSGSPTASNSQIIGSPCPSLLQHGSAPGDAVTGSVVLESAATGSAVPPAHHRPMHPANVQYVRTMAHRILSALTPCIRPGLDLSEFLTDLDEAASRPDLSRLFRKLDRAIDHRLMSAHWQSTRPSRVSDLSRPDAHLTTFVRYLKALWREMPPKQVYRWYVETDQFVTNAVQHAYTLSAFADDSQPLISPEMDFPYHDRKFRELRKKYRLTWSRVVEPSGTPKFVFDVQRGDGRRWSIQKRYSEVFSLMTRIEGPVTSMQAYPGWPLGGQDSFTTPQGRTFPAKRATSWVYGGLNRRPFLERRADLLVRYLNSLARALPVHDTPALLGFLDTCRPRAHWGEEGEEDEKAKAEG